MDNKQNITRIYVSSDSQFYTIEKLIEMLGWSEATVQKLFNAPDFPSVDYGKTKVVENHALIEYFSKKRAKRQELHWKKGDLSNELKKRLR